MKISLAIVLFLHVLSAATWLGAALWSAGDIRRTLVLGRPHTDLLVRRTAPALSLDLWSGVATLLTGIAVLGLEARAPPPGITVGLVAVLVRLAIYALGVRPTFRRLRQALDASDLTGAAAPARRLSMLSGVGHLLWVVALAGMIFQG